jgi:hypothetical protein
MSHRCRATSIVSGEINKDIQNRPELNSGTAYMAMEMQARPYRHGQFATCCCDVLSGCRSGSMASRYELKEAQWERIEDFLPGR